MYTGNQLIRALTHSKTVRLSCLVSRLSIALVLTSVIVLTTSISAFAEENTTSAVTATSSVTAISTAVDSANDAYTNSESAYAVDLFLPFVTSAFTVSEAAAPTLSRGCDALNDDEQSLGDIIQDSPSQQRDFMACNPILAQVARDRARDMAVRDYFGHTNPDGIGPNTLVRAAGYNLPSFYASSADGNNIESIAAGYRSAEEAFEGWLNSPGHRVHMLGEMDFYKDQVEFGVGYYYSENSTYKHYWVLLSAYEE